MNGAKQREQNQLQSTNLEPQREMRAWLASPRGRLLLQRQAAQMGAVLPRLFGYRLLQIGDWEFDEQLLASSATLCQWVLGQDPQGGANVFFDGESLPISSRSVDAVILPHSLETRATPHRLLREVDRVLCDHGKVVILGFNPYSLWAIARMCRRRLKRLPRSRRLYPMGRVCDWLELLDYELISGHRFGVGFPYLPADGVNIGNGGWWRVPGTIGQAYAVVARKRVIAKCQQAPRRQRVHMPAHGMPEPTTRTASQRRNAA